MLNITGYGRLASDILLKTSKDIQYTNFLLATHNHKKTTFIKCVAFGSLAQLLTTYCNKGDRILVSGELIPDKYEEIDTYKIKVNTFDFIETKKESINKKIKKECNKEENSYDD